MSGSAGVDAARLRQRRLEAEASVWSKIRPTGFQLLRPAKPGDAEWAGFIPGPEGTPWEGGLFVVTLEFPPDYPRSAPTCTFVPPVFHPNVAPSGAIGLSALSAERWQPQTHVKLILQEVQRLLREPDMQSPLSALAYADVRTGGQQYRLRAVEAARVAAPPAGVRLYAAQIAAQPKNTIQTTDTTSSSNQQSAKANGSTASGKGWSERLEEFMAMKKDPSKKDTFAATLQPIYKVLGLKARNGPPKADDALANRRKELQQILPGAQDDALEFAQLCFLKTAMDWMRAKIPDAALISLPVNVGVLAAEVNEISKGAFNFQHHFVAAATALPSGKVLSVDLGEIAQAHGTEPWLGQDKIKCGLQVALRMYFSFLGATLPGSLDVAWDWFERACQPSASTPGVTATIVLQFFESISAQLKDADSSRYTTSVAKVQAVLQTRIKQDRELLKQQDGKASTLSPEKLSDILDRLEKCL